MKRKEIKKKIEQADTWRTREKASVFLNTIVSVFEVSDTERLHFWDTIQLYIFFGIEPDFATFSKNKQGQIKLIYSLIKRQRIQYENTLKLDGYDKTTPEVTPMASPEVTPMASPNQDISIKTKDKDLNIKTQDEDEDKGCSPSSSSSDFFIDNFLKCYEAKGLQGFFDGTLTPSQKDRIIELSSKIDDFVGIFWEEVKASDWLQGQDFGKVLHLAERVVNGEYRGHKPRQTQSDDEAIYIDIWKHCTDDERKQYLQKYGCKPWIVSRLKAELEELTKTNPDADRLSKLNELKPKYQLEHIQPKLMEELGFAWDKENRKWVDRW